MNQAFNQIANELSMGVNIPDVNAFIAKLESIKADINVEETASIISIIEKSDGVPKPIIDWVVGKVSGDIIVNGSVSASDTHNLRHLLYSCASDNGTIISEAEAKLLFNIKNATLNGDNSSDWMLFFSQAIGNHLMAHNFDAFQGAVNRSDYAIGKQNFFDLVGEALFGKTPDYWGNAHSTQTIAKEHKVTEAENAWLNQNINQDGKIDEYEQAALDFIAANKA